MLLNLLVEVPDGDKCSIEVLGRFWTLKSHDLEAMDEAELLYTCISYTWGAGREPSPFRTDLKISDRTIPALKALIHHRPSCKHIWIDAFCVPAEGEERASSLESMGYIYSRAEEVVVVLSPAVLPALKHMVERQMIELDDLLMLENEEWVSRAWTYQETVNGKTLSFTCEQATGAIIPGIDLLNYVETSLSQLDGSKWEKRKRFPRLEALENVLLDYMVADFEQRSALHILFNMDKRMQLKPEDHFYAMIGAVSTTRASSTGSVQPCEAFMSLCERKGDYSFIFSAAKRDDTPSKRWRPVPCDLPPILPWHCWGEGQPGRENEGHLVLDDMVTLEISPINTEAAQSLRKWLASTSLLADGVQTPLYESVYAGLKEMGFIGSSSFIETARGFFFPFESVGFECIRSVMVSAILKWIFGGPGLVSYVDGDILRYSPGVYVGLVDSSLGNSVVLL
jgi:Heterokaryon incompatibility protein (HET)